MTDTNRKTWQEFETVVERLHKKFHKNATVTPNDHLHGKTSGRSRQIDVSIRHKLGPNEILIIVECKRRGRKIDLEDMGAFISKKLDVGAHMGIMVAERGFTKGAQRLAEHNGVKVYKLRDTRDAEWPEQSTIKILVESCTIFVRRFDIVDEDGSTVVADADRGVRLFDRKNPEREITASALLRSIWDGEGRECDGDFDFQSQPLRKALGDGPPKDYRLRISFRVESKRFSRDASLKLLGLTEPDETTHTDSFTLSPQPGKCATFYSERSLWKAVKANFAVVFTVSHVLWPDEAGARESLASQKLISMLPDLCIELTANAGEKPISFNFGGGKTVNKQ